MKTKNNIRISSAEELNMLSDSLKSELEGKTIISVCSGTGCKAYSSDEVYSEMEKQLSKSLNNDSEKAKK
jgi:NADH:ubiquinone oxidoreductase subunit E